jgi:hypothetical protein
MNSSIRYVLCRRWTLPTYVDASEMNIGLNGLYDTVIAIRKNSDNNGLQQWQSQDLGREIKRAARKSFFDSDGTPENNRTCKMTDLHEMRGN